jgi:Replication-relaxation
MEGSMPKGKSLTLTEEAAIGLFFIQRYRFLTIDQFARISSLNRTTASHQLRFLELAGMLGHFGNAKLSGHGKTPKVYFLTRKGFDLLASESDIPSDLLGSFKEVKVEAAWSPQMYHRLRTVDTLISAECAIRKRPHLVMVKTFLEYCRRKRGNLIVRETTDFVDTQESPENKIIPDAALIIENTTSGRRALFFLEMDMATERISSFLLRNRTATLHYKFEQYDRYLKGMRYSHTYAEYGDFRSFILLFVTLNETRIENIRRELQDLPEELSAYYRFTTFDAAMEDVLGAIWQSRQLSDTTRYPLVREEVAMSG